jgi:hypothetical protein
MSQQMGKSTAVALASIAAVGLCLALHIRDLKKRLKEAEATKAHLRLGDRKSRPQKKSKDEGGGDNTSQKTMHKQSVGIIDELDGVPGEPGPAFSLEEIGHVRSNFPHRAGCPRQGTLAPHARSHLVMHPIVAPGSLDGLEVYSHVWVLFKFHINVESGKKKQNMTESHRQGNTRGTKYTAKVNTDTIQRAFVLAFLLPTIAPPVALLTVVLSR